jgi:hypothetical protein
MRLRSEIQKESMREFMVMFPETSTEKLMKLHLEVLLDIRDILKR